MTFMTIPVCLFLAAFCLLAKLGTAPFALCFVLLAVHGALRFPTSKTRTLRALRLAECIIGLLGLIGTTFLAAYLRV